MKEEEIGYALSKQVPDMRRGVTLYTNYGGLCFFGRDAEQLAALCDKLLRKKLAALQRKRVSKK